MYRVGLEAILGFTKTGSSLRVDPCIPRAWEEAEIAYRFGLATYRIKIRNPAHVSRGIGSVILDGVALPDGNVPLTDDGQEHEVIVELRGTAETEKKAARRPI